MSTKHARLSPSASKRWMTCPGSVQLIESLNLPYSTSKYAAEGTVAHGIHERCLINNTNAEDYIGEVISADGFKFTVNQDMVDAVQTSVDYIRGIIADAEGLGYSVEMLIEVQTSLKYLGIPGLDGGTSDVILIIWDDGAILAVEIIDYKHGAGVAVEVKDNSQTLQYGLGTIAIPKFNGQGIPEGITITISQPRAFHPDGPIRSWDISKEGLMNWEEEELVPKAKATLEDDAPLVPSDDGCRFCGASGECAALYKKTQEIAIADFKDDKFPEPRLMTSEQKMIVMDHMVMIRAFIVAVEAQVQQEVSSGLKDYEGRYKLVKKTTQRKLTDVAFDEIGSPLLDYLDEDDLYTRKPKGIGELESSLKAKLKESGVKGIVKLTKGIMEDVTEKPEGALVIAPISDKRRAAQPTLVSDFDGLGD